jgi:hypothetical protein
MIPVYCVEYRQRAVIIRADSNRPFCHEYYEQFEAPNL